MGASASKGAKAAGSAARKYPTRAPTNTTSAPAAAATRTPGPAAPAQHPNGGPQVHPQVQASAEKTEAVLQDGRDPAFASRLNSLGAVQPNPHFSPSSASQFDPRRNTNSNTSSSASHNLPLSESAMMQAPPQSAFPDSRNNPVLRVLEARQKITEVAEDEMRDIGRKGFEGRKYVDAGTITLALMRRAKGEPDERIEKSLGIKRGRLGVLGKRTLDAVVMG